MKAIILAAGYATRLYPLTREVPKSLLLVKDRPIIDYIIDKLSVERKISEVIVVTNSKFIARFESWKRRHHFRKKISLVNDLTKDNASRLGAIGDLDFVIRNKKIGDDVLVFGGDNLFSEGLSEFISFAAARKKSPVIGAFNFQDAQEVKKYGVIRINGENRVVDFQEKSARPKSTMVAMCLYYFPKGKLRLVKNYLSGKSAKKDATGLYINWLRKKTAVYAFVFGGKWYDIGDHKFYNAVKEGFAS